MPIVEKTLNHVAFECTKMIEITVVPVEIAKTGLGFAEQVLAAAKYAEETFGISLLCVHTDADAATNEQAYRQKISPAIAALNQEQGQTIVPVVPVHEMEAWMLADKDLFKQELGTNLSDQELGIQHAPESLHDPKAVIEQAIRLARANLTKKRRGDLSITDLYSSIGSSLSLPRLMALSSFEDFVQNTRQAYRALGLLT